MHAASSDLVPHTADPEHILLSVALGAAASQAAFSMGVRRRLQHTYKNWAGRF